MPFPRPLCGCDKLRLVSEAGDKYYVHNRDNVRAWMWPSCVKFESARCVYRYLSLACNHQRFTGNTGRWWHTTRSFVFFTPMWGRCVTWMRLNTEMSHPLWPEQSGNSPSVVANLGLKWEVTSSCFLTLCDCSRLPECLTSKMCWYLDFLLIYPTSFCSAWNTVKLNLILLFSPDCTSQNFIIFTL